MLEKHKFDKHYLLHRAMHILSGIDLPSLDFVLLTLPNYSLDQ